MYFRLPVLRRNALTFLGEGVGCGKSCGKLKSVLWKKLTNRNAQHKQKTFTQIITAHTFTLKDDEMRRQRVHGHPEY